VTVDKGMSFGAMFSLATKYHAFSPGSLQSFTLPVAPGYSRTAGDVEVVRQPQTEQLLMQFLGAAPGTVSTPPLAASGAPIPPPPPTTTTTTSKPSAGGVQGGHGSSGPNAGTSPSASAPPYDPTVCSP
jgi:hypothetical protein